LAQLLNEWEIRKSADSKLVEDILGNLVSEFHNLSLLSGYRTILQHIIMVFTHTAFYDTIIVETEYFRRGASNPRLRGGRKSSTLEPDPGNAGVGSDQESNYPAGGGVLTLGRWCI